MHSRARDYRPWRFKGSKRSMRSSQRCSVASSLSDPLFIGERPIDFGRVATVDGRRRSFPKDVPSDGSQRPQLWWPADPDSRVPGGIESECSQSSSRDIR
jgi:hypothetical protein